MHIEFGFDYYALDAALYADACRAARFGSIEIGLRLSMNTDAQYRKNARRQYGRVTFYAAASLDKAFYRKHDEERPGRQRLADASRRHAAR